MLANTQPSIHHHQHHSRQTVTPSTRHVPLCNCCTEEPDRNRSAKTNSSTHVQFHVVISVPKSSSAVHTGTRPLIPPHSAVTLSSSAPTTDVVIGKVCTGGSPPPPPGKSAPLSIHKQTHTRSTAAVRLLLGAVSGGLWVGWMIDRREIKKKNHSLTSLGLFLAGATPAKGEREQADQHRATCDQSLCIFTKTKKIKKMKKKIG